MIGTMATVPLPAALGSTRDAAAGLRDALLKHHDAFLMTFTENLMTYALGRRVEYYDMPAVRKVLTDTASDNYRMQSIILGIVKSYPFQYRRIEAAQRPAPAAANQ